MPNETYVAVCYCDRLVKDTGVALIYDIPSEQLVIEPKRVEVLGFYQDSLFLDNWQESFGFRAVIGAVIVYVLGMFISIVVDINPRKIILHRLMKDLRNIDRYGKVAKQKEDLEAMFPDVQYTEEEEDKQNESDRT